LGDVGWSSKEAVFPPGKQAALHTPCPVVQKIEAFMYKYVKIHDHVSR